MFEKRILYILLRGTGKYVSFGFAVPLKATRCCTQRQTIFRVVAQNAEKKFLVVYNADYFSPLQATRGNVLSFQFMCFSALLPICRYFSALWTTARKKLSVLLPSSWKNANKH
jgi:hypothetical protein